MQIEWKIEQMERRSSDGVVTVVHYRVIASDEGYTADAYGTINTEPPGEAFTPFEQLTERDVVSWVQHALDKEAVEQSLLHRLELLRVPPVVNGLPWAAA